MNKNLKEDSIWFGPTRRMFKIDKIEGVGDLAVVHYTNILNPELKYSCLIDAFLNRFTYTES
jgi:hypothetical protein